MTVMTDNIHRSETWHNGCQKKRLDLKNSIFVKGMLHATIERWFARFVIYFLVISCVFTGLKFEPLSLIVLVRAECVLCPAAEPT